MIPEQMGIWFSDGHVKEGKQLSKYPTYLNGIVCMYRQSPVKSPDIKNI